MAHHYRSDLSIDFHIKLTRDQFDLLRSSSQYSRFLSEMFREEIQKRHKLSPEVYRPLIGPPQGVEHVEYLEELAKKPLEAREKDTVDFTGPEFYLH